MIKNMIKIVTFVCIILFSTNMIVLESYQTHISNPVITSDMTYYTQGENIVISGWVNYNEEFTSDVLLRIIATNPLGIKIFDENITSDAEGKFSVEIPLTNDANVGIYEVEIISQCREIHRDICTNQSEKVSINVEADSNLKNKIPDWVRSIFVWYANNEISEEELLGTIEFLINENIIQIKNNVDI